MGTKRKSNKELCDGFRSLLTEGFYVESGEEDDRENSLTATKPWRNDMWKAFREIEDRLMPLSALARNKEEKRKATSDA